MVELFASRRISGRGAKYFPEMSDETVKRLGYHASLGPDGLCPLKSSSIEQGDYEGYFSPFSGI